MAGNAIARVGIATDRRIPVPQESGLSVLTLHDHGALKRAGGLSEFHINAPVATLALVQGSGLRRVVDIKTDDTAQPGLPSQTGTARSLMTVSKQLVG